jgi:putative hydrolase of the HAD superfamily
MAVNGETFVAYWPGFEHDWTLGILSGAEVSAEIWRRTLLACGFDDAALMRLAFEAFYERTIAGYHLYEDAAEMLESLRGRLPLALITNGAVDTQWEKLRAVGLDHAFDAVVLSADLGIAKPDPAIFHVALDKLGVAPERVWHVGDSLRTDIAGAKAAGLTAVWLNRAVAPRPDDATEPDYEIASLLELPALIQEA